MGVLVPRSLTELQAQRHCAVVADEKGLFLQ